MFLLSFSLFLPFVSPSTKDYLDVVTSAFYKLFPTKQVKAGSTFFGQEVMPDLNLSSGVPTISKNIDKYALSYGDSTWILIYENGAVAGVAVILFILMICVCRPKSGRNASCCPSMSLWSLFLLIYAFSLYFLVNSFRHYTGINSGWTSIPNYLQNFAYNNYYAIASPLLLDKKEPNLNSFAAELKKKTALIAASHTWKYQDLVTELTRYKDGHNSGAFSNTLNDLITAMGQSDLPTFATNVQDVSGFASTPTPDPVPPAPPTPETGGGGASHLLDGGPASNSLTWRESGDVVIDTSDFFLTYLSFAANMSDSSNLTFYEGPFKKSPQTLQYLLYALIGFLVLSLFTILGMTLGFSTHSKCSRCCAWFNGIWILILAVASGACGVFAMCYSKVISENCKDAPQTAAEIFQGYELVPGYPFKLSPLYFNLSAPFHDAIYESSNYSLEMAQKAWNARKTTPVPTRPTSTLSSEIGAVQEANPPTDFATLNDQLTLLKAWIDQPNTDFTFSDDITYKSKKLTEYFSDQIPLFNAQTMSNITAEYFSKVEHDVCVSGNGAATGMGIYCFVFPIALILFDIAYFIRRGNMGDSKRQSNSPSSYSTSSSSYSSRRSRRSKRAKKSSRRNSMSSSSSDSTSDAFPRRSRRSARL